MKTRWLSRSLKAVTAISSTRLEIGDVESVNECVAINHSALVILLLVYLLHKKLSLKVPVVAPFIA